MNKNADPPQHVAVIMDGNGRWARRRGLPHPAGHRASVKVVRKVAEECVHLRFIGNLDVVGTGLLRRMVDAESKTGANTGLVMLIALGYGGRWGVTQGCRALSAEAASGKVRAELDDAFEFFGRRERRFDKTSAQISLQADA